MSEQEQTNLLRQCAACKNIQHTSWDACCKCGCFTLHRYTEPKPAPDPGSFIRGIACEKHDLVSATIACTRCTDELCKERDTLRAKLEETKENMYRLAQERKDAVYGMDALRTERDEAKAQLRPLQKVPKQVKEVLDCADVDTHHPDIGAAERKPMMLHERVAVLVKERDEWKRRAGNAEYELNRQKNLMQPNPVDWERERIKAARAALQGLLANPAEQIMRASPQQCAEWAVTHTDALIAELQKKEVAK